MTNLTITIPDEYVSIIQEMGTDAKGYFEMIIDDLGKRYEVKVKNEVISTNSESIQTDVDEKRSEASVDEIV